MKNLIPLLIISSCANAQTITTPEFIVKTDYSKFGSAPYSIKFHGFEFINSSDRGRLFQSAVSFDGLGECFNPTEGGGIKQKSTVELSKKVGNKLINLETMAFWLPAKYNYYNGCGGNPLIVHPDYLSPPKNYRLLNQLTFGLTKYPNVIAKTVTYHVPNAHKSATFEALTAYMNDYAFKNAIFYDPITKQSVETADWFGEQSKPVIIYSDNKKYAIGIFSPDLPQNGEGYGVFFFPYHRVSKLNCVFRKGAILAQSNHTFTCYTIFGTLEEVQNSISNLKKEF